MISTPLEKIETTGTTDGTTETGGDKPSNKKTETREITDGKTGGDKHTIKKTETTGTTDGKTGGDKHTIKRLKQQGILMVKLGVLRIPGGDKHTIKRLKQQELLIKLEVISTPLKRLKIKLEVINPPKTGGDKPSNEKTETTGTTDGTNWR